MRDVLAASGARPTLLVFFKTSCPVCQFDFPYLQKLHAAHGAALRVVGVGQNDLASAQRFYAQYGNANFDLLLDPEPAFEASNAFGVESVPHHVLVDPGGTVKKIYAGWSRAEMEGLDRAFASADSKPAVITPQDRVPSFTPG